MRAADYSAGEDLGVSARRPKGWPRDERIFVERVMARLRQKPFYLPYETIGEVWAVSRMFVLRATSVRA